MVTVDESLSPFIEQCDADGERGTWPRPVWHSTRCGYCAKPVTMEDGIAIFCDTPTRICYPSGLAETQARAVLEHRDCGPDAGYWIAFKRLRKDGLDGPEGWLTHLRRKDWFHGGIQSSLEAAYALTRKLAPRSAPVVPVEPRVPRQRGDNPRSISIRTRSKIMERDGFKCRRCGCGPDVRPLEIDHVIPVAKGGTADESNLQTLCETCNAGKSDRDPHEHDLRGAE